MRRTRPLGALGLALASCLYIPYYTAAPDSRLEPDEKMGEETLDFLRGAPTREQVLLRLGEPDWVAKGQRVFVYTWQVERGYLIVASPYGGGGAGSVYGVRHLLLVDFGEDGVVRRSELKRPIVVGDAESWIGSWSNGGGTENRGSEAPAGPPRP